MKIRKAYKYRLKDKPKLEKLNQFTGSCRFVWNRALALQLERLKNIELIHSYCDLASMLVTWKNSEDTAFLKESNAQALQQTLKALDRAFKDAFDKKQPDKRIPAFKKKSKCTESIRIPVPPVLNDNAVYIPKIGWCKFFKSREIEGTPKNFTISKNCGKWYISIQTEIETDIKHVEQINSVVGIDLGVNTTITCSNGKKYNHIEKLKDLESKKTRIQKNLSRKILRSNNWYKNKNKLIKINSKISRVRKDFLHKASTEIINNHDLTVLEDLKIKSMTEHKKGTGKSFKTKLNKAILGQCWFEFKRQLEYKASWAGKIVLTIDPAYTSQECSICGHIEKNNRKKQAEFVCLSCGYTANADDNASLNILQRGLMLFGDISDPKVA